MSSESSTANQDSFDKSESSHNVFITPLAEKIFGQISDNEDFTTPLEAEVLNSEFSTSQSLGALENVACRLLYEISLQSL